jgi:capsular exopolysaccharide synthesis family protein
MATKQQQPVQSIDIRLYIGMIFFRWQLIVICALYALLAAVLYIQFAEKKYESWCSFILYRDPNLTMAYTESPGQSLSSRLYLLQSPQMAERVADRLLPEWGKKVGGREKMVLGPYVYQTAGLVPSWRLCVRNENGDYAKAFLECLLEEHDVEWRSMQRESVDSVTAMLQEELRNLEDKIKAAEDDVIEYERLHDLARTEARGAAESGHLGGLIGRRVALQSEMMMLETEVPLLKDRNVGVVTEARRLTRNTADVPVQAGRPVDSTRSDSPSTPPPPTAVPETSVSQTPREDPAEEKERDRGWQDLRVRMALLQEEEKALLKNLTPENPRIVEIRRQIENTRQQLAVAAEVAFQNVKDRYESLKIHLKAVEDAEYKWQAKDMFVAKRKAELARIQSVVGRYQSNYMTLYGRLHDMKIAAETKAEHFRITSSPRTSPTPVWPNAMKILVTALVLGLGGGFGLALAAQLLDNSLQTIKDVEQDLKIPFLGGVPYWAHSGLERTIRPIVTEEHSAGAVEAYRALRTSVLAGLNRVNEKILLVTSADSREGKTLTALNLAIMIAQMGKRVLLVDMDMRRGRLHRSMGLGREPGATDALLTGRSLREFVQTTKIPNLWLVPTGTSVENASELLQSTSLVSVFLDVQNDYDYVVVDTSPILRVTDTVILATQGVGVILYVARVNHTPKPLIRYSIDMLGDARVLGLVMNSIEMHKISSLYYAYQYPNYAYYSNAYSYGYNYYGYGEDVKPPTASQRRVVHRQRSESRGWLKRTFFPSE